MELHGALVGSPGMGHAAPVLELGRRLLTQHGFDRVTIFLLTTDVSQSTSQIKNTSQNPNLVISFISVDVPGQEDRSGSLLTKLAERVRRALPEIRSAVLGLKPRPRLFVVDLFGVEALAVARELETTRNYVLVTTSAWFLALTVYMASLDEETLYEHLSSQEPLGIPGCRPVQLDPVRDQSGIQDLTQCQRMGTEILAADGVLVNTWHDMEPLTTGSFTDPEKLGRVMRGVPVHPIGPLVKPVEPGLKHEVLEWLDLQPKESVVYVAFGSFGTLTAEQTAELAWGLEMSQKRFVWVVRPPVENDPSASMFNSINSQSQPSDYLPEGFLARSGETGLIATTWVPQGEILAHPSVGGFLTHCGWNSILESVVNGVAMVAWPLCAEQKMNAWTVSEECKIAVGAKADGLVGRAEIEGLLRRVMEEEAKDMRKNVERLSQTAQEALRETGSSYISLAH